MRRGLPSGLRGGAWDSNSSATFVSTQRYESDPSTENNTYGFRLAAVPEPSTWVMGLAGLVCGGSFVRRRRKRA